MIIVNLLYKYLHIQINAKNGRNLLMWLFNNKKFIWQKQFMKCIGDKKSVQNFKGWYFKQQNENEAFAVIAAIHNQKASIQIITKAESYVFDFKGDFEIISQTDLLPRVRIGKNYFSRNGFVLNILKEDIRIKAIIKYRNQQLPRHSMMGPFQYLFFMPCIHEVFNISNIAVGKIMIQTGKSHYLYELNHAIGYIEGDKGNSFPEKYIWTQCSFEEGNLECITAAVAKLSVGTNTKFHLLNFTGCTCMFLYKNKEIHIATYLGAKVEILREDFVRIQQGKLCLEIILLNSGNERILKAPVEGKMNRNIVESVSAIIRYRLFSGDKLVFDVTGANAGYECEI